MTVLSGIAFGGGFIFSKMLASFFKRQTIHQGKVSQSIPLNRERKDQGNDQYDLAIPCCSKGLYFFSV